MFCWIHYGMFKCTVSKYLYVVYFEIKTAYSKFIEEKQKTKNFKEQFVEGPLCMKRPYILKNCKACTISLFVFKWLFLWNQFVFSYIVFLISVAVNKIFQKF